MPRDSPTGIWSSAAPWKAPAGRRLRQVVVAALVAPVEEEDDGPGARRGVAARQEDAVAVGRPLDRHRALQEPLPRALEEGVRGAAREPGARGESEAGGGA